MNETQQPAKESKGRAGAVIAIVISVLVLIGIITAFALSQQTNAPADTQQPGADHTNETDSNPGEQATETATIAFTSDGFSPQTLTVKKGTKVTVVNNSSDPVQFSSDDHPAHRENPEINMQELAPGESGSFTVTTVGIHGFHDHIDDSLTGTLIVTE